MYMHIDLCIHIDRFMWIRLISSCTARLIHMWLCRIHVWHASYVWVTCLMSHSYVQHAAFIRVTCLTLTYVTCRTCAWPLACPMPCPFHFCHMSVACLIRMSHMPHVSFICTTCRFHTCDMPDVDMCDMPHMCLAARLSYAMPLSFLSHECGMPRVHSRGIPHSYMWHGLFTCVTGVSHSYDMPHSYVRCTSRSYAWHTARLPDPSPDVCHDSLLQ